MVAGNRLAQRLPCFFMCNQKCLTFVLVRLLWHPQRGMLEHTWAIWKCGRSCNPWANLDQWGMWVNGYMFHLFILPAETQYIQQFFSKSPVDLAPNSGQLLIVPLCGYSSSLSTLVLLGASYLALISAAVIFDKPFMHQTSLRLCFLEFVRLRNCTRKKFF